MAITTSTIRAAALVSLCASAASANIVTFEGLPPPQFGGTTSYTESGFTITTPNGWMGRHAFGNPGSALGTSSSGMLLHLTASTNAAFALNSLDITIFAGSDPQSTTITGFLTGGGTVSRTITAPASGGWITVNFDSSWSNLTAVEWNPGLIVYDNLNATIPSPAPAVALALAACAATRRRR